MTTKNYILMPMCEPTDKQLSSLMQKVAVDAKKKVLSTQKIMAGEIAKKIKELKLVK